MDTGRPILKFPWKKVLRKKICSCWLRSCSFCLASCDFRDQFLAKWSSFLFFKRFSLWLASCLLRSNFYSKPSRSMWTALSSSLIQLKTCSSWSPILSMILVSASSTDIPCWLIVSLVVASPYLSQALLC